MCLEQYIHINPHVLIYRYPNEQYVAVIIKSFGTETKRSIKDVKTDAIKILKLINGETNIAAFIKIVQEKYDIDEKSILKFIEDSIDTGILYLDDTSNKQELKIVGDGKLILPRHATVEITELCNLKCVYCYNEASPYKGRHMPLKDVKKIFETLSENGVTVLEISGGEPMIHPNIIEILEEAFKYFNWVAIISNGVYFPKNILPVLKDNRKKFGGIQISIDGSNEEVSEKMRQVKNTFSKTMDTIKYLKENDFLVRVVIVLTEDNVEDIENTCNLMRKEGIKHFGISISEEWGRGKNIENESNILGKSYKSYFKAKYGDLLRNINEKYRDIVFNDKVLKNVNISEIKNCGAGWQTIAVTPNGDVEICAPAKIKIGNIFSQDYKDIFSSKLVQKLSKVDFKEGREKFCLYCEDVSDCAMCYSKMLMVNEHRIASGRELCPMIKTYGLEELI